MSVVSYKCPNCGGDLRFEPKSQKYKCEYCLSEFQQEELDKANPEQEEKEQPKDKVDEEGAVVYTCPSCGAEIVTDETTAATFCYYCHNPVVLSGKLSGDYKPDSVIPFKIDKKEAVDSFLEYVKKRKFVPKQFFCKDQIEKITGVYFPFWMYHGQISGGLEAEATNVRIYQMGEVEFTETKFFHVERGGMLEFSELTKNALKKANRQLVEGVQPFDFDEVKEFSMGYLSGFQAEKRDMEKQDFEEEIKEEVDTYTKNMLKDSVNGYTTVNVKNASARVDKSQWNYLLLPVWVLTYKGGDGKQYYFAMNGQTKNICGKLPIDYFKIALLFAAIAVPAILLLLLGGYFLW